METLFSELSAMLRGSAPVALAAAFVWGVLSIILSPCHLASIPLVVAVVGEQGSRTVRRAFGISALFALAVLLTIALVGIVTASLGRMLGDVGSTINYALAVIFVLLGLHFLGVFPLPWSGPGLGGGRRKGLLGAFLLGLLFGIGVGPCTFAYLAPMIGVTWKAAATSWALGVLLLVSYGLGHCSVILAAGTSAARVQRYLRWTEGTRGARILRQACGG
ncbi:MAG: cytochrome C biogenesis protein, partial [Candidatus Eisenbacteria bacterium]|nr:cytochrome C biogenesis protein [Candidatus Latescibacterota bacterium]MBD3303301.1 cytochrome C biogenesis protein [Candidatus Eisenbacteria bacterium]